MSGYEEAAYLAELAAEAAATYGTEAEGASAALAAYGGTAAGAAAGAGAAGLTAAELAAYEQAAQAGLSGAGELSLGGGLLGSGGTASDAALAGAMTPYGSEGTYSLAEGLYDPTMGPHVSEASQYEMMKAKALGALNKVGGQFNKLPAPAQGLLAATLVPKPSVQQPTGAAPRPMPQQPPPSAPVYNQAPQRAQNFASSYGGGLLGDISPEELMKLKRLLARGM